MIASVYLHVLSYLQIPLSKLFLITLILTCFYQHATFGSKNMIHFLFVLVDQLYIIYFYENGSVAPR